MASSPESNISAGWTAGQLEGADLPDLLWGLSRAEATGILTVRQQEIEKQLFFDRGQIVFAASNQRDDRLGELLLRQGKISIADLEAVVPELGQGKRIGSLLVDSGALDRDALVEGVMAQSRKLTLDLFEWQQGEYSFEESSQPEEETIRLHAGTGELVLQGIRSIRSFGRIRQQVGTPRTMYRLCDGWRDRIEGVRLSEGEELLVVRLEQGDESVEGLCREVFLSNFEIYQTLWGLKVLGAIEEIVGLAESGEADWQGTLDEQPFAEVLVRAASTGETGILHLSQRTRERTFHFVEGRCVFATSNNPDDGLVAYLLRRGVISLNDREETAKRLLSNKRVGTILRELGVIDERDLEEMVRQQLAEVVSDSFSWDSGSYAFYAGDLPSAEEITLDRSVESLIAEGVRRVQSWTRVVDGCGGLDESLELDERYLDVLDRLDAGADEWAVITALKTPATARELADAVDLPDFRVCQILWTLRILNAIVPFDAEAAAEAAAAEAAAVQQVELEQAEEVAEEVEDVVEETVEEELIAEAEAEAEAESEAEPEAEVDEEPELEEEQEIEVHAEAETEIEPEAEEIEDAEETVEAAEAEENLDDELVDEDEEIPVQLESDDEAATVRMSREEVEAALAQAPDEPDEPQEEETIEPEDLWEPPSDLESSISRFNAMQRLVFRTVRSEVGAGAVNFIRSCVDGEPNPIEDVEMASDGSWDVERLRANVVEFQVDEPWELYHRLIENELETLRSLIGEAKVIELQKQVEQVGQSASS